MEEEFHDHFWLNLIIIFYILLGSIGTFLLNVSMMNEGYGFLYNILLACSSLTFPAISITTFMAFRKSNTDAIYLAILYLCYNAVSALLQLELIPICIDIVCFVYFLTSDLVEYLLPSEIRCLSRRFYYLTILAVVGIISQVVIYFW